MGKSGGNTDLLQGWVLQPGQWHPPESPVFIVTSVLDITVFQTQDHAP